MAETIPSVLGAVFMLVLGWLVARLLAFVIRKSLIAIRFDQLLAKTPVSELSEKLNITQQPSALLSRFFFWVIILMILTSLADAWRWTIVSEKISALISYFPNILLAIVILIGGMTVAGALRNAALRTFSSHGVRSGKTMSNILFYLIVIIAVISALDQLQLNVDLLTSNFMIVVGGIALAFAIGYGLSAKEILPHLISSFYLKNQYHPGQVIRIGELEGEILEINNINVVLTQAQGKVIIPAKRLVSEDVHVLS